MPCKMERNKSFQNKPMLYLISTPIGNLGEISKRTIEVLESCDLVGAEDTRNSFVLHALPLLLSRNFYF